MGGCASKPKDADLNPQAVPAEVPATPNKDEGESIPQGNENGGESQNAAPLVDLSEPKQETSGDSSSASKAAEAEAPVSAQVADLTAELTQEKVEAIAKESEEQTEASTETNEPAKEGQTKAEIIKSDAAPSSENKSGAPVVAV